MEYVYSESFDYQRSKFYIDQIERLIEVSSSTNKVEAWAPPIVSFFSGKLVERNDEVQPLHSAIHIFALDYAEDKYILRKYFIENYKNVIQWVSLLYFYFRTVNGYPILANELLDNGLLAILDKLSKNPYIPIQDRFIFTRAYSQLLSYAIGIKNNSIIKICLDKINQDYYSLNEKQHIELMCIRSLNINKTHKNYYASINFLKEKILEKSFFDNTSVINTIYLEDRQFFLQNFKVLKKRVCEDVQRGCTDNSIRSLIANLLSDNFSYLVQEILYEINYPDGTFNFIKNHAFIVANSTNLSFYDNGVCSDFGDQYIRYKKLIGSQNIRLGSYTSLAFDDVEVAEDIDYGRYHVADHELSDFIIDTISCYRINEISYQNFENFTFLPIDTHPVQACLVLNKKIVPPLINISFDGKKVDRKIKKILCFLTRDSYTHDKEYEFFLSLETDYEIKIITDPNKDLFIKLLNDTDYDILYISAHGKYEHFTSRNEKIVFWNEDDKESYIVSTKEINEQISIKEHKKILILNICDGANCGLSYLVSERGVANKFAIKGHTVLSYLWPVESKYAVVFGCLVLYELRNNEINQAYFDVLSLLNTTNENIYQNLVCDEKTKVWADLVLNFSGFISESHLYSSAIYT